jgi:hypothetical protein
MATRGCKKTMKQAIFEKKEFQYGWFIFLHKKNSIPCIKITRKKRMYTHVLEKVKDLYRE